MFGYEHLFFRVLTPFSALINNVGPNFLTISSAIYFTGGGAAVM